MNAIQFDTLAIARKLQAAGFPEQQAEAVTNVVRDSRDASLAELVTKADLRETEMRLDARIVSLKSDTEARFIGLKSDMDARFVSLKSDIVSLKSDMDSLKSDMDARFVSQKADIEILRSSVKSDMADFKSDMMKWVVGAIGFQTVVIIGAAFAIARMIKP